LGNPLGAVFPPADPVAIVPAAEFFIQKLGQLLLIKAAVFTETAELFSGHDIG